MAIGLASAFRHAALPLALAATLTPLAASAALLTYGFGNITNNNATNATTGETQLFVDVSDVGLPATQVSFEFRNIGPLASSITDVYFDDGSLFGIASISSSGGVAFSQGASPPDLPGGNSISPAFQTTAGFLADSDPPAQPNGVNPNEWLKIVFNLIGGQTFDDVIAALTLGLTDGGNANALRIGIHVQGFADGGSESFVNTECQTGCDPDDPGSIPEPGTLALLGLGLMGLAARRRISRG